MCARVCERKFLHEPEIHLNGGRKLFAKGATSQTLCCALANTMPIAFTCMHLERSEGPLLQNLITLSVVITVNPFFDLKMRNFRLSLFSFGYLDPMNAQRPLLPNSVSVHEMENRFRITFAFEKPKYTRLQMDFWIIESQWIENIQWIWLSMGKFSKSSKRDDVCAKAEQYRNRNY